MLLDLNTPYVSEEQAEGTVGESVSAPQSLNCAFLPKMMETPKAISIGSLEPARFLLRLLVWSLPDP